MSEQSPLHLASGAISVIGTCNLACRHCYSESSPSVTAKYSLFEVNGFLSALQSVGVNHVFFGGGEPLLHPDLPNMVKWAFNLGFKVSISSNGQLIRSDLLKQLAAAGLTHDFSVSLDGPNRHINDSIRGAGSFLSTLSGIYVLRTESVFLWGINYVSCKQNLGHAAETARLAKRLGAGYFNLIRFSRSGRGLTHQYSMSIDDTDFFDEAASIDHSYTRIGDYYGDIFLYDLVGNLQKGTNSYFDDPRFDGIPSGISISAHGPVELTPAKVLIGNCRSEDISTILQRLSSSDVLSQYSQWLRWERDGVHRPRFARNKNFSVLT